MPSLTRLLLILFCILGAFIVRGQDYNPYKTIGKKAKILTASGGKYVEVFDYDSVQRIGSILLNIYTKKIVRLLKSGEIFKRFSDNSSASRWYSLDPLANKYANVSPYTFVENNPIRYMDPNGDSLVPTGSHSAMQTFNNIVNTGLGGFYTVGTTSTGKTVLNATGQQGTMNSQQQSLYNALNGAITSGTDVHFNIIDNNDAVSHQVMVGDCGCYAGSPVNQHTIDVGDASQLGTTGVMRAQGIVAHEITEGTEIQTNSYTQARDINRAHSDGIAAENHVNGGIRVYQPGVADMTVNGQNATLTVNFITGVTTVGTGVPIPVIRTVNVNFTNGNVSSVQNNNLP